MAGYYTVDVSQKRLTKKLIFINTARNPRAFKIGDEWPPGAKWGPFACEAGRTFAAPAFRPGRIHFGVLFSLTRYLLLGDPGIFWNFLYNINNIQKGGVG